MRKYFISINNTFNFTNSPIVLSVGYYNTYQGVQISCITLLDPSTYSIRSLNNDITILSNNSFTAPNQGSYTIQILDNYLENNNQLVTYSLYIFNNKFIINDTIIYNSTNRQLPSIYNRSNKYNDIDNIASSKVINDMHNYHYNLFWNILLSLGVNGYYNTDKEFTYFGINGILKNASFPAELLQTVSNIDTQGGNTAYDLMILISRICLQFLGYDSSGNGVPVEVVYDVNNKIWNINIYNVSKIGNIWVLGDSVKSILGTSTYLGGLNTDTILWFINYIIYNIIPLHIKYYINYYSFNNFTAKYNTSIVGVNDFYDFSNPTQYGCFQVINNNNNFNTKGYILK